MLLSSPVVAPATPLVLSVQSPARGPSALQAAGADREAEWLGADQEAEWLGADQEAEWLGADQDAE